MLSAGIFSFGGQASGTIPSGAFRVGTTAGDLDDRIIYNSSTHALYYDPDGTGAAAQVQFATVDGTAPVATDIILG